MQYRVSPKNNFEGAHFGFVKSRAKLDIDQMQINRNTSPSQVQTSYLNSGQDVYSTGNGTNTALRDREDGSSPSSPQRPDDDSLKHGSRVIEEAPEDMKNSARIKIIASNKTS